MTGGLGFSRAAQASFENNSALRKKKHPFQTAKNNQFVNASKLTFKEASEEKLAAFKEKFLKEKKCADILQLGSFILFAALFLYLSWYWLFS
jgi:hypothetical protein